ncbi:class I SAM-dependent methyltransferase [Clostridium sp. 19966]|uniref:class I SAM-dependent methyltransferase n=1 Tax=Clostridium sp. 19966 TaxID=2768166 RepID=UPI0028DDC68E|nr:class I SAM-dependent methyltransferase [Clostridium sp. 19966]MDT8717490.1 class I SAM-dependent methyltransferase [Clostridium sp. 19966]
MKDIFNENFKGKTILEIGTGRGGTTRELAAILSEYENSHLITTDISDKNFCNLKKELLNYKIPIDFIKTDACTLEGIEKESIDYIVCNYTLCAINSNPGSEVIALDKFMEVLKPGGVLYIEEEFPITFTQNEKQEIWSDKWKILKSCTTLLGEATYNEINPEVLIKILNILKYRNIQLDVETALFLGKDCLDFFMLRLNRNINAIENTKLTEGIKELAISLKEKALKIGGMEIPTYSIIAYK